MSIQSTEEKLYQKESGIENRPIEKSSLDPHKQFQTGAAPVMGTEWQTGAIATKSQKGFLFWAIIAFVIVLVAGLVGFGIYLYKQGDFSYDNTKIDFDLADSVESGKDFTFKVLYHNNNRVELKNVSLKVFFPASYSFKGASAQAKEVASDYALFDLGTLKPADNGAIELSGVFLEKDRVKPFFRVVANFELSDGRKLEKEVQKGVEVNFSKLSVELSTTRQAASGDVVEFYLKVRNNSMEVLNGVEVHLTYPVGFTFSNATPQPANEEKTVFKLLTLGPQETREIKIAGNLVGNSAETKKVIADVGLMQGSTFQSVSQMEGATEITNSPLSLVLKAEANQQKDITNIKAGDTIYYTLSYKNNGQLPLRDVVIATEIQSKAVNFVGVSVERGTFDVTTKKITWRGGNVPELAILEPGESGELRFQVPVLGNLPSNNPEDKHFDVVVTAQIDSPDVPSPLGQNKVIVSQKSVIKVSDKIFFSAIGLFYDQTLSNSGPLPPRVGEKTTYTIHWKVTNVNNDLNQVEVRAVLPGNAQWENNTFPQKTSEIIYNDRTKEVLWKINTLAALTGTLNPAREVAFQVGITPQASDLGNPVDLLGETVFKATDVFTGESYNIKAEKITTAISRSDKASTFADEKVTE